MKKLIGPALLALVLPLAACGGDDEGSDSGDSGTTVRPSSLRLATRPASTQRRTVSSLTPSSSAASAMRYVVTAASCRICGLSVAYLPADADSAGVPAPPADAPRRVAARRGSGP